MIRKGRLQLKSRGRSGKVVQARQPEHVRSFLGNAPFVRGDPEGRCCGAIGRLDLIRILARHLLGPRVGGAVPGHFASRPHRYEGPDGVFADKLVASAVDDRHAGDAPRRGASGTGGSWRFAGADVVARFETARVIARANDIEG